MAKRRPKPHKPDYGELIVGFSVAAVFFLPSVLGFIVLVLIFSVLGYQNPARDVFIGFSIPCALVLLYRWRVGEWPTPEDKKDE